MRIGLACAVLVLGAQALQAQEQLSSPHLANPAAAMVAAEPAAAPPSEAPPAADPGALHPLSAAEPWRWRIVRTAWTEQDERAYGEFVQRIGESQCRTVHD